MRGLSCSRRQLIAHARQAPISMRMPFHSRRRYLRTAMPRLAVTYSAGAAYALHGRDWSVRGSD